MFRITIALSLLASLLIAVPAVANETVPDGRGGTVALQTIVFPVDGPNRYTDTWGASRDGGARGHEGVDIMADKMVPVLAAADGVVTHVNWNRTGQAHCCTLQIQHDTGWVSRYIHLNNDTPGTDDGQGWGIAPGIERGSRVRAGEFIGWVGDSGNAESTAPHLHFELHTPAGVPVNPYPHVVQALEPGSDGRFVDTAATVHRDDIDRIAELGITRGCNPPANTRYCPERTLTRGEVAAMITRTLGLPRVDDDAFADDTNHLFEHDVNALAAAGIAFGCTETDFCTDEPLRRDEMARFLVRAFGYEASEVDAFADDAGDFEAEINALAAVGVTKGCNPPDNTDFCPDRTLTRAEFASFMVRALDRR